MNHPFPKITIVTPSFNQGHFLQKTIESVLNQNYPNLEYFIMDGGSTDNSVDIMSQYDDQITKWVSEPDRGQSDAINKGFQMATGELCAWVNSDDLLLPGCLTKVATAYLANNSPDIIHSNCIYIDRDGLIVKAVRTPRQTYFFAQRGVWSITEPSVFYRTDRLRQVGYLDLNYRLSMDLDLWIRLLQQNCVFVHIPEYLGAFRWHEASKSSLSLKIKGKRNENSECSVIFKKYFPSSNEPSRRRWRQLLRLLQLFNLNYLKAYLDLLSMKGKLIEEAFSSV
jgi:glycosyltransferase involved in cell wall biosynthesis